MLNPCDVVVPPAAISMNEVSLYPLPQGFYVYIGTRASDKYNMRDVKFTSFDLNLIFWENVIKRC